MSLLHSAKAIQGPSAGCVPQCKECFQKFQDGADTPARFDPCFSHNGGASLFCCMGNPSQSFRHKTLIKWLDKESNARDCRVKAKSAFLPRDILDLQQCVASVHFRMWDFQNFVMILGAIHHAGRFDGVSDTHFEDF
jgi:hypothetical protein